MYTPFEVRRFGPKGPDVAGHQFSVVAIGHPEMIRTKQSGITAAISGASSTNPKDARAAAQKLCDALNEQWTKYMNGEFHDQ